MAIKQLVEKREELAAKQKKLQEVFKEGRGPDGKGKEIDLDLIKSLGEMKNEDKLNELRKMDEEIQALGKEVDRLTILDDAAIRLQDERVMKGAEKGPVFPPDDNGQVKGFGDLFVETPEYKSWRRGHKAQFEVKNGIGPILKATFSTSAGWAPETTRIGRIVEEALRPIQVIDTIPGGRTGQAAIVYMEETTVTSAAAERAEAGAYAESELAFTEQSSTVRSIGTSLPVTDEQLEDVEQVRSYLNMRLAFLVRQRLDGQILVGNGVAPNLLGLNGLSGIQTQAKGADPAPDAIYKAMVKVRVTGRAMPSVVYAHPNDWQAIRLLRTVDGIYIWGNPSEAGPMRIWGIVVVETDAQTENTVLVGDAANFCQLFMRRDVAVEIGYVNDDFTDGRVTFRAGLRAALVGYRPAVFCTVTGM